MSIIVDNISYIYEKGTGFERQALKNVSCAIEDGEFIGLIGHTGSGKSTFIQHLNGLVKPTEGHIYYNGRDIYEQGFNMKELRSRVGLVFQYPEHQLFETEIFKDVCFGPKNLGLSQKEVEIRAFESLRLVGIDVFCSCISLQSITISTRNKVPFLANIEQTLRSVSKDLDNLEICLRVPIGCDDAYRHYSAFEGKFQKVVGDIDA